MRATSGNSERSRAKDQQSGQEPPATVIYGRNPVLEALQAGVQVQKIYLQHGMHGRRRRQIVQLARRRQVPVSEVDAEKLQELAGAVVHQGVAALVFPVCLLELEELIALAFQNSPMPCLVFADGLEDPHNLGAIIRSAEVLGAQGLLFPARRASPITTAVVKASAGAIWHLPLCRIGNSANALVQLKAAGFWIYGADSRASNPVWTLDFARPMVLIVGSEGKGLSQPVRKQCDTLFAIPGTGHTESLNASVAAGIALYEALRQRTGSQP